MNLVKIIDCLMFQRQSFVPYVCACVSFYSSSSCVSASTLPCDACACDQDRDWVWPIRHYGNLQHNHVHVININGRFILTIVQMLLVRI